MRQYLLIGAAAFVLGAGSMAYVSQTARATPEPRAQTYHMLELFGNVVDLVERQYVTPVDDKKLIGAALDGIKAGDYITAVDGQTVLGLSVNDAVKQMRGKPGEIVTLTIAREKTDPFDVKLAREIIQPKSVTYKAEGDYGYLRLAGFNEKATDETRAAIADLRAKNPHMKGLVLDLRNNPGGLLDQAVGVADLFLNGGEVVSQRGRDPRDIERYNAKPGDKLNGLPVVVLINSGSA